MVIHVYNNLIVNGSSAEHKFPDLHHYDDGGGATNKVYN